MNGSINLNRFPRSFRWLGTLVLVLGVAVWAWGEYGTLKNDSPAFDRQKAARLTPEKRRTYDVQFFNEFYMRSHGNQDFQADAEQRYQLFRHMAEKGYEVAHLALQLYDIRRRPEQGRYNEAAVRRLEELAADGDVSAMCFLYPSLPRSTPEQLKEEVEYTKIGAKRNHPACAFWLAMILEQGVAGVPKDPEAAMKWLLFAAGSGSLQAQQKLYFRYYSGKGLPRDYAKALCWIRAATRAGSVGAQYNYVSKDRIQLEAELLRSGMEHVIEAQNARERSGKLCDV